MEFTLVVSHFNWIPNFVPVLNYLMSLTAIYSKREKNFTQVKGNKSIGFKWLQCKQMAIYKEIKDNQIYLYMNGQLIYKRWLDTGQSLVFDVITYDKNTLISINDKRKNNKQK